MQFLLEDCEVSPNESSMSDHWSVDVKYASDKGHVKCWIEFAIVRLLENQSYVLVYLILKN
jgi:hypothetical protein